MPDYVKFPLVLLVVTLISASTLSYINHIAAPRIEEQKKKHGPIGQLLVESGRITESDLHLALAAQMGMEPVDLEHMEIPDEVVAMVPVQTAQTYKVVPVHYDAATNTLSVALASPDNFQATDDLQTLMGFVVKPSPSQRSSPLVRS